MILGLTGKKGHGKDTLAAELVARDGYTRLAYADALKVSAAALFGVPVETWNEHKNDPNSGIVLTLNGESSGKYLSVREFLQRYGTEAHRDVFGDTFWLDVIERELRQKAVAVPGAHNEMPGTKIVVTDCRFDNEADLIRKYGGLIVEVYRPQVADAADTHSSEDLPRADVTVWNGGTPFATYMHLIAIFADRGLS